ncbi:hypothetical protein PMKS-001601 [Pichia membranifaciens]|uniref:Uncharacterized protein n=1 Tax=Pichia membranifaciens TaxID=4926 RepID=A0A1Q2YEZ9_9ASCO|nr:hypothetical protein PMKS-001601 [Pichia membranifaciens]
MEPEQQRLVVRGLHDSDDDGDVVDPGEEHGLVWQCFQGVALGDPTFPEPDVGNGYRSPDNEAGYSRDGDNVRVCDGRARGVGEDGEKAKDVHKVDGDVGDTSAVDSGEDLRAVASLGPGEEGSGAEVDGGVD